MGTNGPSARQHMKIFDEKSNEIGEVTSGCLSPSLKQNIAMGYVATNLSEINSKVLIEVRKKKYEAHIAKLPLVPTRYFQMKK